MKGILPIVAGLALAFGGMSVIGCSSSDQQPLPRNESGSTAGGNGAFGENPARPGDYRPANQSANSPATNPTAAPN